jgi:hypothetical protein
MALIALTHEPHKRPLVNLARVPGQKRTRGRISKEPNGQNKGKGDG